MEALETTGKSAVESKRQLKDAIAKGKGSLLFWTRAAPTLAAADASNRGAVPAVLGTSAAVTATATHLLSPPLSPTAVLRRRCQRRVPCSRNERCSHPAVGVARDAAHGVGERQRGRRAPRRVVGATVALPQVCEGYSNGRSQVRRGSS
jgi:hypothetical protein